MKHAPHVRRGIELALSGLTMTLAAKRAKCSVRAIQTALRAAGHPPRPRGPRNRRATP